jgi:iron(III) transport system permease protein
MGDAQKLQKTRSSSGKRITLDNWQMLSLVVSAVVAIPLFALVFQAVQGPTGIWSHIASTVLPVALRNTIGLLTGVGVLVAVIGTGTAWLVTAYDFPGRSIISWALVLPLAVPTYIIAYVYLDILHPVGPLQTALRTFLGYSSPREFRLPDVRSLTGCIMLLGLVLYPYVYVATRAMFLMQSATFIDAARTLGVGQNAVFWRIAAPLAKPAIVIGTSLALMEAINDIGASEFLGVRTLTVAIYNTWVNGADLPGATQIALGIMIVVVALLSLERWARRHQRFSNSAQRASHFVPRKLPIVHGLGVLAICCLPVFAGFAAPVLHLTLAAFHRFQFAGVSQLVYQALFNTVVLASAATVLTLAGGIIVSYAHRLHPGRLANACMRFASLGYAAPGTVVAIGVLFALAGFDNMLTQVVKNLFGINPGMVFMGTGLAVIYAYMVRFLAVSAGGVDAGLDRLSRSLDRASRSLGNTATETFRTVNLPLARPAIAAAGLLIFVDCVKELPATLLLRPLNFETFATLLYAEASRGTYEDGSIFALSIVLIGVLPLILVTRIGALSTK